MKKATENAVLGNIRGKREKREGRTILEDYSIYIFNI